ncbi:metal-dependent hydrolase [Archaeoglobales archaeon ex4484_92]|nr:MAG: metal-dependent hydrolase [Archaeoglobales archaeon ex4484_92]
MIITDDHMHLYNNLRLRALEQFKKAGGTHVFLVTLLSTHYDLIPRSGKDFEKIFETHLRLVEKANKIVKAYAVLGVHPAEITILGSRHGYEKATEIMKEALEIAGKYVERGDAVAIKSGRPHYKVSNKIWKLSNEILMHAFEVAKEIGCAVQLHTERYSKTGMLEISKMADKVGIKKEKIVKHFSPPLVSEFESLGIFPSVIAIEDHLIKAAKSGSRFMVESDYIDDKRRPGAVVGPKTVPKKIKELLKLGYNENFIYKICVENIQKVYGIEL